jgi:inner membrane protein
VDILTQGLLGAVFAQVIANKEEKKLASIAGAAAGLLADADILIRSSSDPLLTLEYHRHFSHSLFFIPFGAAIAMLLLWPLMRRRLSLRRLYIFCLAGYSLSGLLDACTSYGTYLFWPLSNERVALNIISIVDPIFTLSLLIALIGSLILKERKFAILGLCFCLIYLSLGFMQLKRAEYFAHLLMINRGHNAQQQVVKPTLGNLVLWRSVYMDGERIYVDAIRIGFFSEAYIFVGNSLRRFSAKKNLPWLDEGTTLHDDIQRFTNFSNGFVAFDPTQIDVIGDIRYSLIPHSTKPLWGIVIDLDHPQQHAGYRFFRESGKKTRKLFIDMVTGEALGNKGIAVIKI